MDQEKKLYSKVDTSMNFAAREQQVIDFWNKENVFEDSVKEHEGGEEFSFYDGPPTANGKPHIGHILTRVMKDIDPPLPSTMKGKHVLRKAGWDTHGLPVELEVEKLLGIDGKAGNRRVRHRAVHQEVQGKSCGNTRANGKACPSASATGWIWNTPTSPTTTITSSRNGGHSKTIYEKGLLYKGHQDRSVLPALRHGAFSVTRWRRATRTSRNTVRVRQVRACRPRARKTTISWLGRPRPGRCLPTWRCA